MKMKKLKTAKVWMTLLFALSLLPCTSAARVDADLPMGVMSADADEMLPYRLVHSLRNIWSHLGVSNVVIHTPTEMEEQGVVQVRVEVNLTADAPLRDVFGVSNPAGYVDVVQCLPSNALTAVAFSNDLHGVVAVFGCLQDDLPEIADIVDLLADGLDGVIGGMAAATVPDSGSPLGIGRMGFCGISGEDGWTRLTNALDRVMDIEALLPRSTNEIAAIRVLPGHFYSKIFGGNDAELSLVESKGRYLVRGFSSSSVRERYDGFREERGSLFDNPDFLRCSEGLRDRAGLGFVYVSKDFVPTVLETAIGQVDLLKGYLMCDAVWSFSVVERGPDGFSIVSRMPRGEENLIESAIRCSINTVGRWLPMLPELVSFETEGRLESTTVGFISRVTGLVNAIRQMFFVAGIDYAYCTETSEGRSNARIPEPDEEFVASRVTLRVAPEEEDEEYSPLCLIAAGKPGENPAEEYLPNSVVSAVACQPNVEAAFGFLGLALSMVGGGGRAAELFDAAFSSDTGTDGHSFALAQTAAAGGAEPDILIVSRIGSEASFRNLKDCLDKEWVLEDGGGFLVLRRVSGTDEIQKLRLAFLKEKQMFFLSTSQELLDQSLAAGSNACARLNRSPDFIRMMGEKDFPHNTMRYNAGNIFGRAAKRLSNVFSCVLPEWLVAQVLGSGLFDLGECGFGVRSGNTFVHYGRAPKSRHETFRSLALAAVRSLGEVLQKSCPYGGETARVFESAFTRQDLAAADAGGMTTVRVRDDKSRIGGGAWTFDWVKPLIEDMTMAVNVSKVTETGGCTYIPSSFALVGLWEGANAGLMSVAFENPKAMPELPVQIAKGDGGVWTVSLSNGAPAALSVNLPRGAELEITVGGYPIPPAAFMGWGQGLSASAFSLALNPEGVVAIGGETIPVMPLTGDLKDDRPLAFDDGKLSVTIRTIPGFVYELWRGRSLNPADNGWGAVASEKATGTTVTLVDAEPPVDRAFYRVDVGK